MSHTTNPLAPNERPKSLGEEIASSVSDGIGLLAGGVVYTAGAAFFLAERFRFFHFVWHLFVIAGTACHFYAVLRYSA